MAAISVTASSVAPGSGCTTTTGTAGATITAGQCVYVDASNLIQLVDVDASDIASTIAGVSLNAATSGQPVTYATGGHVTFNAVLVKSKAYVAGATAGEINPIADHTTAWRMSLLGIAKSTTSLLLTINNTLTVP